jgi:hypothetical protein
MVLERKERKETYHESVTKPSDTQRAYMSIDTTIKLVSEKLISLT